jgi:hypothetical protein
MRSDIATILLIRDNLGIRPIYFSWSDGAYPDNTLGLGPYLVTHGLVRKLMPAPVQLGGSIVNSPSLGPMDVERTRALLFGVYHPEAAARPRARGWVDAPSASILSLYGIVYGGFAPMLMEMGDTTRANEAEAIAEGVERALRLRP